MKVLATLFSLALSVVISLQLSAASTDLKNTPLAQTEPAKVGSAPIDAEQGSHEAKGLYRSQLEAPKQPLNVGIQYWIELKKPKGQAQVVNNLSAFHSGDQIRLHMKPNIDGYAYVVLKTGNKAEPQILFPDVDEVGKNRVTHGQEIVVPPGSNDAFEFDATPGVEKLTLFVARKPINTTLLSSKEAIAEKQKAAQSVVCVNCGANDLIPAGVLVSYSKKNPEAKGIYFAPNSAASTRTTTAQAVHGKITKPIEGKGNSDLPSQTELSTQAANEAGIVTVVSSDADGVLAADVTLQHI